MKTDQSRSGFTLTDLLMVIGIIIIVGGVIPLTIANNKKKRERLSCLKNLKVLAQASLSYANDHNGDLTGCPNYKSDDLNWLYSNYVSDLKNYVCASTRNTVRPQEFDGINSETQKPLLKDLFRFAPTKWDMYGHSYEQFGYWGKTKKTVELVKTRANQNPKNAFDFLGRIPGPANIWLMADGDNTQDAPAPPNKNDYPNEIDHHWSDGANVNFADGHAEWIPQKNYPYRRELSLDQGKTEP